MQKEQKLRMISEIKRIEQELYLKKSQLTAAQDREHVCDTTLPGLLPEGLDAEGWEKVFSELIKIIGRSSIGGNSVEDIKMERQR